MTCGEFDVDELFGPPRHMLAVCMVRYEIMARDEMTGAST